MNKISRILANKTVKDGSLFAFFSFLNSGISFILLFILARYLTPSDYGTLNLFNTLIQVLSIFIALNSAGIISVEFFKSSKLEFSRTLNTVLLVAIACFLVFSCVFLLFRYSLENLIGFSWNYQYVALLVCFLQVLSSINLDIWRLEEKPLYYGIYSTAVALLNCLLSLLLVISFHMGWKGRMYAQLIAGIFFFVISISFLIRRGYFKCILPNRASIQNTLKFGIPLIPHGLSFWLRQGMDRYIINYFHSSTLVGLFGLSGNFASVINVIGMAFNATNTVFIYKNLATDSLAVKHKLRKQTFWMIIFFAAITLIVILFAYVFIPLFFSEYVLSLKYIIPLCIGGFAQCIYLLYVNYLFYYKKTAVLARITFSISCVHFLLSLWLSRYSVLLTAYINMFTSILIAGLVIWHSKKIYSLSLK